jgi:hypothetical protein
MFVDFGDDWYWSGSNTDHKCETSSDVTVSLSKVNFSQQLLQNKAIHNKQIGAACGEAFSIFYLYNPLVTIDRHFPRLLTTMHRKYLVDLTIVTQWR